MNEENQGVTRSSAGRSAALRAEPVPVSGLRPAVSNAAWADQRLARLYGEIEELAAAMPRLDTEGAYLREAMRAIELADTYVEKREREA